MAAALVSRFRCAEKEGRGEREERHVHLSHLRKRLVLGTIIGESPFSARFIRVRKGDSIVSRQYTEAAQRALLYGGEREMSLHVDITPDLNDEEEDQEMIDISYPLTQRVDNSLRRRISAALEAALNELIMRDATYQKL